MDPIRSHFLFPFKLLEPCSSLWVLSVGCSPGGGLGCLWEGAHKEMKPFANCSKVRDLTCILQILSSGGYSHLGKGRSRPLGEQENFRDSVAR